MSPRTVTSQLRSPGTIAIATILLVGGCGGSTVKRIRQVPYATQIQSQFTVEEQQNIDAQCGPYGMPRKTLDFGSTNFVVRDTYVLEHSPVDKIPIWVAHHLEAGEWESGAERPDASNWKADAKLPKGKRAELADYRNSGYDRGHMAPNGDFGSYEERLSTFVLSNSIPQNSDQNQDLWSDLEDKVRGLAKQRGEAYVVTGGMFYECEEDPEANCPGGDGTIDYYQIGANAVAVPTHTFKAVLVPESNGSDTWEAFAFVVPNKTPPETWEYSTYAKSVDWVEQRAGLDLFPELTGADEARIEGQKRNPPF